MSLKKILACLTRADLDYNLINEGDRIAIGVSGGKDSMLLLKAMKLYQKYPFKHFDFYAVFLDLGFGNVDINTLKDFCTSLDVKLHIEDSTEVNKILSQHKTSSGNLPCSICSRMKKAAINKVAHQLNCNKVAFAHHCDDAIETLLMNTIYGGRIATFSPKMYLDNTKLTFIRPFILVREKDIISCCKKESIPIIKSSCPNDHYTMREEAKNLLNSLYTKYPSAYQNYRNMLSDYLHFDLWIDKLITPIYQNFVIKKCFNQEDFINFINLTKNNNNKINYNITDDIFLISNLDLPIGYLCINKNDKTFIIYDFYLDLKYGSERLLEKIILFIESFISSKINPCTIAYDNITINHNILEKLQYVLVKDKFYTKDVINAYRFRLEGENNA